LSWGVFLSNVSVKIEAEKRVYNVFLPSGSNDDLNCSI